MNPSTDQKRLLIAVVVSTAILLLWYTLFPPGRPHPQPGAPGSEAPASTATGAPGSAAPGSTAAAPGSAAAPEVFAGAPESTVATLTAPGRQSVELSSHDGQVRRWLILEDQYQTRAEGEREPFTLAMPADKSMEHGIFLPPRLDLELGGQPVHAVYGGGEQDGAAVLTATDPKTGVRITRKYTLDPEHYGLVAQVTLENPGGAEVPYDLSGLLRAAQNEDEAGGGQFSGPPVHVYQGICAQAGGLEQENIKAIAKKKGDPDETTRFTKDVQWSGVDSRYFLTALLPEGQKIESCQLDVGAEAAGVAPGDVPAHTQFVATHVELTGGTIPAGGQVTQTVRFFGGPKKYTVLQSITPPLTGSVNFGYFRVVSIPMLWLMQRFHDFIGNWGVAIILLTLLVKLLTLPLTQKQYKSMAAMKKLQPQLKALQEKYKDDRMRQQQEMMKLYKENKVSPFSGCLPVVMMMPVYIALYRTIYSAVELYRADFALWIHDLSEKDPTFVMPLVLGGLMLLQQRLSPATGDSAQQKMMLYFMPVMFTLMMAFLPSGLVLYIMVNTLLGIVQQYVVTRKQAEATGTPAPVKAR
jgi:YidC/Oxa1 family membrane protein insertase